MFGFLKAKRRGMPRLFGWSSSNTPVLMHDPRSSFARHKARECKVIARRWDALAQQAETAEQRRLREQIASGWRDLAGSQ
jgi:hypothetical protein